QTWQDRTLFTTEHGWYYAREARIAAEADAVVRESHQRYTRETGHAPPRGLIIITTPQDDPVPLPEDPTRQLVLEHLESASLDDDATDDEVGEAMTPGQREAALAAAARMFDLLGSSFQLNGAPAPIPDLPPEAVRDAAWVALLPSRSLVRRVTRDMMEQEMRRDGVPLAARIMAAPVLAWAESTLVDAMVDAHRFRIFEIFAATDTRLSEGERSTLLQGAAEYYMETRDFDPPDELLAPAAAARNEPPPPAERP